MINIVEFYRRAQKGLRDLFLFLVTVAERHPFCGQPLELPMDYRQPFRPISKLYIHSQRFITINAADNYRRTQKGIRVYFPLLRMEPQRHPF
jgi:hypothetical protein